MSLASLRKELKDESDLEKALILQRFFKTGKGEYGEGDIFLGVIVPKIRLIAKKHERLSLSDIKTLLESKIHEERLASLFILVAKYKKGNEKEKKRYFDFYIKNTKKVNNWDLVDSSAAQIVGAYLRDKEKLILLKLAKSENVWERRIAIVATYEFIRNNHFSDTFRIAEVLLSDKHDLIHKAVGWMLREVGKKDEKLLEAFLHKNKKNMPRTSLRYALERFSKNKRKKYLSA